MQKILVTGATGFIGQAVLQALHQNHAPVVAGVREYSTTIAKNIEQIPLGDLSQTNDYHHLLSHIDIIIHSAARAHILHNKDSDPLSSFRQVNTQATLMLAKQAAQAGVKRFIFLSSIKVNGEFTHVNAPFTPEINTAPSDPYALSKFEAEQGLKKLATQTNMEVVIIRPPLVYGPGVKANFANLVKWVRWGIPLPFAGLNNKRAFIAIDNLVSFIIHCLYRPQAANETFLVSDGADISTAELLRKVAKAQGKQARLFSIPTHWMRIAANCMGQQKITHRLFDSLEVDSSKTKQHLGWQAIVSMEEQLNRWLKK